MQTRWFYNMYCKYVIVHKMLPWFVLECHFGRLSYFEFLPKKSEDFFGKKILKFKIFFLISNFSKASLTLSETDRTDSETDPEHSEGSLEHSHILASLITLFQNQLFHTFQPFISERTIIYKYRNIITCFYDLIVIMTAPGNWYWNWPKNCNFFNFLSRDFFLFLNSRDLD